VPSDCTCVLVMLLTWAYVSIPNVLVDRLSSVVVVRLGMSFVDSAATWVELSESS